MQKTYIYMGDKIEGRSQPQEGYQPLKFKGASDVISVLPSSDMQSQRLLPCVNYYLRFYVSDETQTKSKKVNAQPIMSEGSLGVEIDFAGDDDEDYYCPHTLINSVCKLISDTASQVGLGKAYQALGQLVLIDTTPGDMEEDNVIVSRAIMLTGVNLVNAYASSSKVNLEFAFNGLKVYSNMDKPIIELLSAFTGSKEQAGSYP